MIGILVPVTMQVKYMYNLEIKLLIKLNLNQALTLIDAGVGGGIHPFVGRLAAISRRSHLGT